MARNIAPGLLRNNWSHQSWPDFNKRAWRDAIGGAEAACQWESRAIIAGCDKHEVRAEQKQMKSRWRLWCCNLSACCCCMVSSKVCKAPVYVQGALILAQQGLAKAGVADSVRLRHGRCVDWHLPRAPDIVMVNPPWGSRLAAEDPGASSWRDRGDEQSELGAAWQDLRDFLKAECAGVHQVNASCDPECVCRAAIAAVAALPREWGVRHRVSPHLLWPAASRMPTLHGRVQAAQHGS